MNHQKGRGHAKFRVRHNALLLREFTVDQMIRVTALKPESVRTEIQRMRQEGLLYTATQLGKWGRPGRPPALYRLTDDATARRMLSESLEAFYLPLPPADQPTSRHYVSARQKLEIAQTTEGPERARLLHEAESDLEWAVHAEGGGLAPEIVRAYLQYEGARLAFLRNERQEAENGFQLLRGLFADAGDEATVETIDEYLLCLKVTERFPSEVSFGGIGGEVVRARCLIEALDEADYSPSSPLASVLVQLVRSLSQTADEKIGAAAYSRVLELWRKAGAETRVAVHEAMWFYYRGEPASHEKRQAPADWSAKHEDEPAQPEHLDMDESVRVPQPPWPPGWRHA